MGCLLPYPLVHLLPRTILPTAVVAALAIRRPPASLRRRPDTIVTHSRLFVRPDTRTSGCVVKRSWSFPRRLKRRTTPRPPRARQRHDASLSWGGSRKQGAEGKSSSSSDGRAVLPRHGRALLRLSCADRKRQCGFPLGFRSGLWAAGQPEQRELAQQSKPSRITHPQPAPGEQPEREW